MQKTQSNADIINKSAKSASPFYDYELCERNLKIPDHLSFERNGCFSSGFLDEYFFVVFIVIRIDMCAVIFPG